MSRIPENSLIPACGFFLYYSNALSVAQTDLHTLQLSSTHLIFIFTHFREPVYPGSLFCFIYNRIIEFDEPFTLTGSQ